MYLCGWLSNKGFQTLSRRVCDVCARAKAALLVHETMRVKQLSLELTGLQEQEGW